MHTVIQSVCGNSWSQILLRLLRLSLGWLVSLLSRSRCIHRLLLLLLLRLYWSSRTRLDLHSDLIHNKRHLRSLKTLLQLSIRRVIHSVLDFSSSLIGLAREAQKLHCQHVVLICCQILSKISQNKIDVDVGSAVVASHHQQGLLEQQEKSFVLFDTEFLDLVEGSLFPEIDDDVEVA